MRGEKVVVRAYGGRPHVRRVWDTSPDVIYVCSEKRYQQMLAGEEDWPATGFPKEDVFCFDPAVLDTLMNEWKTNPAVWQRLEPWKEEASKQEN